MWIGDYEALASIVYRSSQDHVHSLTGRILQLIYLGILQHQSCFVTLKLFWERHLHIPNLL